MSWSFVNVRLNLLSLNSINTILVWFISISKKIVFFKVKVLISPFSLQFRISKYKYISCKLSSISFPTHWNCNGLSLVKTFKFKYEKASINPLSFNMRIHRWNLQSCTWKSNSAILKVDGALVKSSVLHLTDPLWNF